MTNYVISLKTEFDVNRNETIGPIVCLETNSVEDAIAVAAKLKNEWQQISEAGKKVDNTQPDTEARATDARHQKALELKINTDTVSRVFSGLVYKPPFKITVTSTSLKDLQAISNGHIENNSNGTQSLTLYDNVKIEI